MSREARDGGDFSARTTSIPSVVAPSTVVDLVPATYVSSRALAAFPVPVIVFLRVSHEFGRECDVYLDDLACTSDCSFLAGMTL